MQGNCEVCSSKKIPWMEAEIQSNCTLLQVRCSSLLIDRNQTYTVCNACVEIERFEASAKSLELKPRYRRKGALLSKWCALHHWPLEPQHTPFIAHAREARIEKFQENSSNRSRDTDEKVLCSTSVLLSERTQYFKQYAFIYLLQHAATVCIGQQLSESQ
jgi:hypothetical protein